jgi:hypothetical protein
VVVEMSDNLAIRVYEIDWNTGGKWSSEEDKCVRDFWSPELASESVGNREGEGKKKGEHGKE